MTLATYKPNAVAAASAVKPILSSSEYYDALTHAPDNNLHDIITAIGEPAIGESAIGEQAEDSLYPIDKLEAHVKDVPHVAVSIFIFHKNRLLLQRRAQTKYHSGGLWANTVCSHPRWQETVADCATRRLQEEIGLQCGLKRFGVIDYRAQVGELFENEQVHCYVGRCPGTDQDSTMPYFQKKSVPGDPVAKPVLLCNNPQVAFNPDEVMEVSWLTLEEIDAQIQATPEAFTEWFKIYMSSHRQMIYSALQDLSGDTCHEC